MNLRPWQRQSGESPADFTLFAAYLRLKGRRSSRAVAAQTGRSPGAVRRLSARFNWPARVAAFEARLADATQDALDSVLYRKPVTARDELEQLRIKEFLLAHQVIHESHRWLGLATDPRRRQLSLMQICRLIEMAFKLKCLATGMPFDQKPRRPRKEDRPGYWTGPSAEEALEKIYGSKSDAASDGGGASVPASFPESVGKPTPATGGASVPASRRPSSDSNGPGGSLQGLPDSPSAAAVVVGASVPASRSTTSGSDVTGGSPQGPRCDAWSRWARTMRRMKS